MTKTKPKPATEPAFEWLKLNVKPDSVATYMRFVGWLQKTGTRDAETLLALVKHAVVYQPRNPHAYFTAEGTTRTSIAMKVGADAAIREHERIKEEERKFLGGKDAR